VSTYPRWEERGRQVAELQSANQRARERVEHLDRGNQSLNVEVQTLRLHAENLQRHLQHYEHRVAELEQANQSLSGHLRALRFRLADKLNRQMRKVPLVQKTAKGSVYMMWMAWKGVKSAGRLQPARVLRNMLAPPSK
jgi:chromosome segregation ATPase